MADNEDELVDYDEEEVRWGNWEYKIDSLPWWNESAHWSFPSIHCYLFTSLTYCFCDFQEAADVSAEKSGEAKDTKKWVTIKENNIDVLPMDDDFNWVQSIGEACICKAPILRFSKQIFEPCGPTLPTCDASC